MLREPKRCLTIYHLGEFQTHSFHVVPSMGPIVLVVNSQGQQNWLQKSRLVSNGTANEQCLIVGISWANKME